MARLTLEFDGHSRAESARLSMAALRTPGAGAFQAEVRDVRMFRLGLLAIGSVVRANFETLTREEWEERLQQLLDPVVGIHPDGLTFEGFSQDGSTLGWLRFDRSIFSPPDVQQTGTTSVDFSEGLWQYVASLTPGSALTLEIGTASGLALKGPGSAHHEKRINLPDGWVHGFGEMHAGLAQAAIAIPLDKSDLFNILRVLKTRRDVRKQKRALVFELQPGERAAARLEPWDLRVRLNAPPPPIDEPAEIKVYGRRRLALIEGLIPHMTGAVMYLIDSARPAWLAMDFPGARFVLALSAWMARKFTKSMAESLRGAAAALDNATVQRAAAWLADAELAGFKELAGAMNCPDAEARAIAQALCRQGIAICDSPAGPLRYRPIRFLPFAELTAAGDATSREERARELLDAGRLEVEYVREQEGLLLAAGRCEGSAGTYALSLALQPDGAFARGECECAWMRRQRGDMKGGPCKHLLALRAHALAHRKAASNARMDA